jgi:hypothetical protein
MVKTILQDINGIDTFCYLYKEDGEYLGKVYIAWEDMALLNSPEQLLRLLAKQNN